MKMAVIFLCALSFSGLSHAAVELIAKDSVGYIQFGLCHGSIPDNYYEYNSNIVCDNGDAKKASTNAFGTKTLVPIGSIATLAFPKKLYNVHRAPREGNLLKELPINTKVRVLGYSGPYWSTGFYAYVEIVK